VIRICGIIGCVIRDPRGVKKNLRWIYTSQKERGMRGAGFSIYRPATGTIDRVRAKKPQKLLKDSHLDNLRAGDMLLFHHRLPTSTPNIEACNHPIVNEDGTLHLIHNGWVISASYHYDLLRKKGHVFETEIDNATARTVRRHTAMRQQRPGKKKQRISGSVSDFLTQPPPTLLSLRAHKIKGNGDFPIQEEEWKNGTNNRTMEN
jgi:glucosamine 6-phosphate synthetase-like amidotransferase/phosphosugar isomerase protein